MDSPTYPRGAVRIGTTREYGRRMVAFAALELRPAQAIARGGLTITHEPIAPDALEVAITGSTYYATRDGSIDRRYCDIAGGGQNVDSIRRVGTTRALRIAELWDRWHLNGMRSGCAHQSEEWTCTRPVSNGTRPPLPAFPCATLNGWPVIRATYGEHAYPRSGTTCHACGRHRWDEPTDACPESGYRWGTSWLYEPVPADVLDELRALFGKPAGWSLPADTFR